MDYCMGKESKIRSDGNPMYTGQWKGWVRDQGIIITKSGRMSRRESNAFRKKGGQLEIKKSKFHILEECIEGILKY